MPSLLRAFLILLIVTVSCLWHAQGGVVSWGRDTSGQLGLAEEVISRKPAFLAQPGILAGKKVVSAAVTGASGVVLTNEGLLYAWGTYPGNGTASSPEPVPVDMSGALAGKTVKAIAAGGQHYLALTADGKVYGWGAGGGVLGQGDNTTQLAPIRIDSGVLAGQVVVKIAGALNHSMAITAEGRVAVWGPGSVGRLGTGSVDNQYTPVYVDDTGVMAGVEIVDVSGGLDHCLALGANGRVYAWGNHVSGKLGDGSQAPQLSPIEVNMSGVMAGQTIVAVSAGNTHSLALASDGSVFAWGEGTAGQLGHGKTTGSSLPVRVEVGGELHGEKVISVSAGSGTSQALTETGKIFCWGTNRFGELGDGSAVAYQSVPVPTYREHLPPGEMFVAVKSMALIETVAAVTMDGELLWWGEGKWSTVLTGLNRQRQNSPKQIALGAHHGQVKSLAVGQSHSLAASGDFTYAWGSDSSLQLGNPTPYLTRTSVPTALNFFVDAKQVAAGVYHSMLLSDTGRVYCWGRNAWGQVGSGTVGAAYSTPRSVSGLLSARIVKTIAAGWNHSLVLTTDNKLYAWGLNSTGQLGNGGLVNATVPVEVNMTGVLAGKTIVAIAAGSGHNLVLASDGTVAAWGANSSGQLGSGSTGTEVEPVLVDLSALPPGAMVKSIAAGSSHSLLVTDSGAVYGWGRNDTGQLGLGHTGSPQLTPSAMVMSGALAGKQVAKAQGGTLYSVLLTTDGVVYGTGDNTQGCLGTGDFVSSDVPVPATTATALTAHVVTDIAAGADHVLALTVPTGAEPFVEGLETSGSFSEWVSYLNDSTGMNFRRVRISDDHEQQIQIRNLGVLPLGISSTSLSGPDAAAFSIIWGGAGAVGPGGNRNLAVRFTPEADRLHEAVLVITSDDPVQPEFRLRLAGRGIVQPRVMLPYSIQVDPGQAAILTSEVSGTGPFAFQWYKQGSPGNVVLPGATGRTLTLNNLSEVDEGYYILSIKPAEDNQPYWAASGGTYLAVADPPGFFGNTATATRGVVGSTINVSARSIQGSEPMTYQWQRNGADVPGATNRNLTLVNVTPNHEGVYRLIATNGAGSAIGPPVHVTVDTAVAPTITRQPDSAIAFAGKEHVLEANIFGTAVLKTQWYKNGLKLAGATAQSRVFKALALADAGSYEFRAENSLGAAATNTVHLSVLQRAPATLGVKAGGIMTLKAVVKNPPGSAVIYRWFKGETELTDGGTLAGQGTSTLKITAFTAEDAGAYDCLVSVTGADNIKLEKRHGGTMVHVPQKPTVADFMIPAVTVGMPVQYQIVAGNHPSRFTATGLPIGLKLDAATGFISGVTKAVRRVGGEVVPYTFTVTVSNGAGTGTKATGTLLVQALPEGVAGSYAGIITRNDYLNGKLGGSFKLTIAGTGAATGSLALGAKSYPFASSVEWDAQAAIGTVNAALYIDGGLTSIAFQIAATGAVTGSVSNSLSTAAVTGDVVPWTPANRATAHVGAYNHVFQLPESTAGNVIYPKGAGFAIVTVTSTGAANWAGTLADGSTFTCGGTLGKQLRVPLFALVSSKLGSVLGWSDLGAGEVAESIDWFKAAPPAKPLARSYADGIPRHSLKVIAARYVKPITPNLVLGLTPAVAPATNARFTFSHGGLTGYATDATITKTHAVVLPAGAASPGLIRATVTPATGRFSGSFTLKADDPRDVTPPYAVITRTVTFNGLIVPRPGFDRGDGQFNLPELPTGSTAPNATPILSGVVRLLVK